MIEVNRRHTLSLAAGGMLALAGCSELSSSDDEESASGIEDDGELPSYASILPAGDHSPSVYGAIDFETMATIIDEEDTAAGDEPDDPLIGNPIVVAVLNSSGFSHLANSRGAAAYSDNDETPTGEGTLVYANGAFAIAGEYDYDGLHSDLDRAGYDLESESDSSALFSDADTDETVGITDDVYAFSYPNPNDDEYDPLEGVDRIVETATGEREPKHETDDDFEWLLRTGETGGITLGVYTDDETLPSETIDGEQPAEDEESLEFEFGAFEDASAVHQHLAVESDGARASTLVTYAGEDSLDSEELESALGTDAASTETMTDDTAVRVDGEYTGELTD